MTLAQATDAGAASASIVQVGAVGGVLVLALLAIAALYRQITANAKADRERADLAQEQLRQAHADMVDKVMPALAASQQVFTAVMDVMRDDRRNRG